jgi:hypothetical protein
VTIGTFDLRDVDDAIARFLWLFLMKNLDGAEKPQWIVGAVAIPDEPLMKACIARARTSFGKDISTAKACRATILFNPTALAFGADCSEST